MGEYAAVTHLASYSDLNSPNKSYQVLNQTNPSIDLLHRDEISENIDRDGINLLGESLATDNDHEGAEIASSGCGQQSKSFPRPGTSQTSPIENVLHTHSDGVVGCKPNAELLLVHLGLPQKTLGPLQRKGYIVLSDLAGKTHEDLAEIRLLGPKGIDDLESCLSTINLTLPFCIGDLNCLAIGKSVDMQGPSQVHTLRVGDKLSDLSLSIRVINSLRRSNILTVGDLAGKSSDDLLNLINFGQKSLDELVASLEQHGISFPVPAVLPNDSPLAKNADAEISNGEQESLGGQIHSDSVIQDVDVEVERERLSGLIICAAEECLHDEILTPEDSIKLLLEAEELDTISIAVGYELSLLQRCFFLIESTFEDTLPTDEVFSEAWLLLRKYLFLHYANLFLQGKAFSWLQKMQNNLQGKSCRDWYVYLKRCCGLVYQSIGDQLNPPITRERVRQLINRVSVLVGANPDELLASIHSKYEYQKRKKFLILLQAWIFRFGRFAFKGDAPAVDEDLEAWDSVLAMNPLRRLELYQQFSIPIPPAEWDVHYDWICNDYGPVGNGYWKEFERLKEFIYRHAAALGAPELMPKQTSFPRRVGGIVQNFGGQSKVAKRLGLRYQGQLIGEDGSRTYWTEDKLSLLLDDVNQYHKQDISLMPSYSQIYDFFREQTEEPYAGKNPSSPIAAMTRQGSLHWSEVASHFGKQFIPGSSTASVTLAYIKAFVRDLGEHLEALSPSELYVLFQAQGINRGDKEKFSRTFDRLVDAVQSGMVRQEDLQSWGDNNEVDSINKLLEYGYELKAEGSQADKESLLLQQLSNQMQREFVDDDHIDLLTSDNLPNLDPVKTLRALDKAANVLECGSTDADRIEFLKAKATAKLWDACFADEESLVERLRSMSADIDIYSTDVRTSFLEEYEGAQSLQIPTSYKFCDLKGRPRQPKLMQRLVAFRLKRDYRLLNLSGTGTGKTLSAVFAAQVCGCKRIIISCPNGVIPSWQRTLSSAYPDAVIHVKPDGWELPEIDHLAHVVIVNHERFQNRLAQSMLEFCLGFRADLVVIDEIHQAKQRGKDSSSQRRKLMDQFIYTSGNINSELRVLGLSATPVINNLFEGRSLIELICQESLENIDDSISLNACMNLYQHFVVHGLRMNPGHLPRTEFVLKDVDVTSLLQQVVGATRRGSYHDVEQMLVTPKLEALSDCLEPGQKTVIFITYIKNTLEPLCNWLEQHSYRYSVYTGDDKEAREAGFHDSLDEFMRGSVDVLVASIQCAGTGVDGLQSVCNRAVFLQLPWTSTEFEQAIGRLDRDGTEFDSVKVYLPITDIHLPNGERWSWCRSKLDRIRSKRDIAKAAVDGEVPDEASMISPGKVSEYWLEWLKRLDGEQG